MTLAEAFFRAPEAAVALPALCRRFHVSRLDLFGSAATGRGFDPARSDLDFLVAFEPLAPAGLRRTGRGDPRPCAHHRVS